MVKVTDFLFIKPVESLLRTIVSVQAKKWDDWKKQTPVMT